MSNYHILEADQHGNRFTVVFHVPVPDAENDVSVNYRTAIVEWQGGAPVISRLPSVGAEQTQLDAGELYEKVEAFNSNPNETLAQKQARLDARFNELADVQDVFIENLQKTLSFWGHARDVP